MANQQLLDYIKQQTKGGTNKESIKNALLQNDWSETDVDEAFSTLQAPTSVSSAPIPPSSPTSPNLSTKREESPFNKQRQLHPRAVWLFFFNRLIAWIFISGYIAFQVAFLSTSFFGWFIGIFIIIIILSFIIAKLTYHFYRYELTDSEYKAERGIIWKRYISIPYERIQNVDIYRGIFDRLLGLSDLNIQTAGYGAAGMGGRGGSEGRLPGLDRKDAELIREELIKRAKQNK